MAADEISWVCDLKDPDSWRSGGPAIGHPELTSFDLMDEILRRTGAQGVFPNLKAIVLAGHSAGGQFVTRYQMANQVHDTLGVAISYIVANASGAYLDSLRPTAAAYPVNASAPGYMAAPPAERFCAVRGRAQLHRPITIGPTAWRIARDTLPGSAMIS